ncbi:hypothetical protein TIFTF001_035595 [Ficus carica]|uniref:Uncharacterized protein n=1 Tax=Ficus carica TaxID=3494 RepID=A0AA88JBW4_FICCA|nr:hypothetical protein TIFTF001_035595 [Ficus carica]
MSTLKSRNSLQPPPGFNQQAVEKKPSVEDLLSTFIVKTRGRFNKDEARLDNIETHCNNMNATMKSLEVQIGQLANVEFFQEVTHDDPLEHSLTTPLNMTDFGGDFCIKEEGIVASVLAHEALPCKVGDVAQVKILEDPDECFTSPSSLKEGLVL